MSDLISNDCWNIIISYCNIQSKISLLYVDKRLNSLIKEKVSIYIKMFPWMIYKKKIYEKKTKMRNI